MIYPGKYLVTGIAGTGKTSVAGELSRRGFHAYSTDEMPEVSCFVDRATGAIVEPAKDESKEAGVDFTNLAWHWNPDGIRELVTRHTTVFIGASVMNQYDHIGLFDASFVLLIDEDTLCKRIAQRAASATPTSNSYGQDPADLARILSLHAVRERDALDHGAIPINSVQPLPRVADDILSHLAL